MHLDLDRRAVEKHLRYASAFHFAHEIRVIQWPGCPVARGEILKYEHQHQCDNNPEDEISGHERTGPLFNQRPAGHILKKVISGLISRKTIVHIPWPRHKTRGISGVRIPVFFALRF